MPSRAFRASAVIPLSPGAFPFAAFRSASAISPDVGVFPSASSVTANLCDSVARYFQTSLIVRR
eukprot:scaffold177485_cov53-Attheya_sp.AAC.1